MGVDADSNKSSSRIPFNEPVINSEVSKFGGSPEFFRPPIKLAPVRSVINS
jgi:hypothetical protein